MPGDATPPPELPPGLLAEYLESARSQLGVLAGLAHRIAARSADREALDALRREIHKVHGSAGSYGFMDASRLAAGMEATVKDWVAHRPRGPPTTQVATAESPATAADREAAGPAPPSPGPPATTSASRRETPTGRAQAGAASGNAAPRRPVARRPERAGSDLCGGR